MIEDIVQQYDKFAKTFVEGTDTHNAISRKEYYTMLIDIAMKGKTILDVGCGDGYDIKLFEQQGAHCYGIDASNELVRLASDNTQANIITGNMEHLPYEDQTFDLVVSKYALQASTKVPQVLAEMDRVLKPGGTMAYLAVHPLRQFLEKKKHPKDYFTQEIVTSVFFGGTVSAHEPTHTMNEYLNPEFLSKYRITHFSEHGDFPSSEKVNGDTYPCFFVLKAIKQ
ncbi:class I SAM-dependent methyltransferase [Candidatus Woesearchaeota archaeon]|nr:class I SAM-dependent methyltransferase [Candidatus Woesearchaeota archaeon]